MTNEVETLIERSIKAHCKPQTHDEFLRQKEFISNWCERTGCAVLASTSAQLFRLQETGDPPVALYVRGNASLLGAVSIAVVGTRRPSNYGLRASLLFSQTLADRGFCIISGLAYGVDTAAHEGALRAEGTTIAVLGHGLDQIYPRQNYLLAERILESGGCLVSEYPPGVSALPFHFPRRNRIISGLSVGTVVIEAAAKSGSLITAKAALEQGREVFVVPGAFDDPGYHGSHQLVQQGAKLVTTPEDVLSEFPQVFVEEAKRSRTEIADEIADYDELRNVFFRCGGSASLAELVSENAIPRPSLLAQLASASRDGRVCEIYPQQYVWVEQRQIS